MRAIAERALLPEEKLVNYPVRVVGVIDSEPEDSNLPHTDFLLLCGYCHRTVAVVI